MLSDLSDLVALELASVLAGPSVGQFLAELGATVIKVENVRTQGDVTRRWKLPSEPDETDISSYFACCNWGKQSVALDLKSSDGRSVLHDLARESDVVIASYRPGAAEALGADAETLREINPRLLYAHLTGYGPDDPRPGYDAVIQAESGFMSMNGEANGPPLKMPVALMDILAAHQLKEALLVGLLRRERTGAGGYFTVSLLQAAVSALANQATNWLMGSVLPERMGSAHPNIAPYGTTYRTKDGKRIMLAVGTDRQFVRLCRLLGIDSLASHEHFETNQARVRQRKALTDRLRARIANWTRDELLGRLAEENIPAGAVRDMQEVFETPQAAAMVLRHAEDYLDTTGLRQKAFSTDTPSDDLSLSPPSDYGAHTRSVLQERLGLGTGDIERLQREGSIYAADLA